jgi:predicted ribosome quality control (RQC) complex YloA/Tae2 family protein
MAASVLPSAKDRFTSLDTLAVVRELRAYGRWRVDKVFDRPGGSLAFTLRAPQEGRREWIVVPGRYVALLPLGEEHSEELQPFARELRRLLTGAAVKSIHEPGGERLLEIEFDRTDAPEGLLLAVELFGTGNLLVARGGKIAAVAHAKTWAHRSVRVGAPYARPPERTNPWTAPVSEFEVQLARSRTDRSTTLAARLALGGPLAEEILLRAGVEGTAPASQNPGETAARISATVAQLLTEVGAEPKGYLYRRGESVVSVDPFPAHRWRDVADVTQEILPTFSAAAHRYFAAVVPAPSAPPSAADVRRAELERLQQQQREAIAALEVEYARLRNQADTLLANYAEAEAALGEHAAPENGADVVVIHVAGVEISLAPGMGVRAAAQQIYEEAKRAQTRLAGARRAHEESATLLASPELVRRPTPGPATETKRRAPHWFEKYRWFISSEGAIVVGGRDAATNDLIVRRYLKDGDLYVHADIHGAPSVIVKHPAAGEPPLTERTLREAGQWGVAYSKAWRAGLASAAAFWVKNDQVSKAGASGEFVARGAWVIHGTKNTLRDLPTELAVGFVSYQGAELLSAAPPEALRSRGRVVALVTPGEERDRDTREIDLARDLGVARSRLQGLLPAGGLSVRRP